MEVVKIAPENADIFGLRGILKVLAGKHRQLIPLLKRALRLDERNPTTPGSLVVSYGGLAKTAR